MGVVAFVVEMVLLCAFFLWYTAPSMTPITAQTHLAGLPPSMMMKVKMVTVAYECYNYCGFVRDPCALHLSCLSI